MDDDAIAALGIRRIVRGCCGWLDTGRETVEVDATGTVSDTAAVDKEDMVDMEGVVVVDIEGLVASDGFTRFIVRGASDFCFIANCCF